MPKKKIMNQTVLPLDPAPPVKKPSPPPIDTRAIIHRLYELAMEGNVTAAKVVLDYCHEQQSRGEGHDLSPGEILALIRNSLQSIK
ncbi:MAG: hypothetical protein FJY66_06395 [Calditrichaeota bacterium]|nr:hypothetical protein [Calditrichota bacterium]